MTVSSKLGDNITLKFPVPNRMFSNQLAKAIEITAFGT